MLETSPLEPQSVILTASRLARSLWEDSRSSHKTRATREARVTDTKEKHKATSESASLLRLFQAMFVGPDAGRIEKSSGNSRGLGAALRDRPARLFVSWATPVMALASIKNENLQELDDSR